MKTHLISKDLVNYIEIQEDGFGQRLDNYLVKILKGVPKSHIHRIIRAGEVRINKRRCKPDARLNIGDIVRIPPVRLSRQQESQTTTLVPVRKFVVVYEDEFMLIINKPSGVAVHGGSGISYGVIEQLRELRKDLKYLELVHRLDKDTSGLLIVAKKRSVLVKLHSMWRQHQFKKKYLALGVGKWEQDMINVKLPLIKYTGMNGEKMVRVANDGSGQSAHTILHILKTFSGSQLYSVGISHLTLLEAILKTGRTHQIRVHMQANHCPIAGDERYGDYQANKRLQKLGLKRMFLHAYQLEFTHPITAEQLKVCAPLPQELQNIIHVLGTSSNTD